MTFEELLQKNLSAVDLKRMYAWMATLDDAERMSMMQFIADRETKAPAVGDAAPDFELPLLGGDERVRLSAFRGQRPVALIFGSFT